MNARKISSFVFICLFLSLKIQGQNTIFTLFKSDLKKADLNYKNLAFQPALELYKKVLEEKGESEYLNLQIARTYKNLNKIGESEIWYANAQRKTHR